MTIADWFNNWTQQASHAAVSAANSTGQGAAFQALPFASTMNDNLVGPLSGFMETYSTQISQQLSSQISYWAANTLTSPGALANYYSAISSANTFANLRAMQAAVQSSAASLSSIAQGVGVGSVIATPVLNFGQVWAQYGNQLGSTAFHQAFQNAGFEAASGLLIGAGATALAGATVPAWAALAGGLAVGWAAKGLGENISKLIGPINFPQVGGVLFENCDAVLTGVAEITGAYWDAASSSLVLVGKAGGNGSAIQFVLPAMDLEHLTVALRAALAGQSLGVSIDPPANYRYGDRSRAMMPEGSPLIVSYLGGTAGTLYGAIMFEADRLMKCLSIGKDNQTQKPFNAAVPGFQDLFQMSWDNGARSANHSWHRFWFVIDRVEIKKSPLTQALTFGDVRLKVLTEMELSCSANRVRVDPNDQAFALHLTTNYEAYAREFPILARLRELAKISALAKFLVNQNVPLDVGSLFDAPPVKVATPETTPSIIRTGSTLDGNITRHRQMSGGVDMDQYPIVSADTSGAADRLQQAAGAARPGMASDWYFQSSSGLLLAKALPLGEASPFRHMVVDHQFPAVNGLPPLMLKRVYDSSKLHSGQFGPGWNISHPFALTVFHSSGKRQEVLGPEEMATRQDSCLLLLHDSTNGLSHLYRKVAANGKTPEVLQFGRVTSQTLNPGSVSFQYDPADLIIKSADRFQLQRGSFSHIFDSAGRLLEICFGGRCQTRCEWQKARLVRLSNDAGQSYAFDYTREDSPRIKNIKVSTGQEFLYDYNIVGGLREVKLGLTVKEAYQYDIRCRLVQVRDGTDSVLAIANYTDTGGFINAAKDRIFLPTGATVTRTFLHGRVSSLTDDHGGRADFAYGSKGQLNSIMIHNRSGHIWKLEYQSNGTLKRLVDPLNRTIEFSNFNSELISDVILPDRRSVSCKRDVGGNLTEFVATTGESWRISTADLGRATSFVGPGKKRFNLSYLGNSLSTIRGPGVRLRCDPRKAASELNLSMFGREWMLKTSGTSDSTLIVFPGRRKQTVKRMENGVVIKNAAGVLSLTKTDGNGLNLAVRFD